MKGLILIYLITAVGSLVALRRPLIGLYIYIAFAVLRPQFIWGWAGDMSNLSFVIGLAALAGWALNGFGSWNLGRSRGIVLAFLAYAVWNVASAVTAVNSGLAYLSLVELAKILLPLLMGVSLIDSNSKLRPLIWIVVLAQGYVGFEMNLNYLRGDNSAAIGFGGMDNNFFAVTMVTVLALAVTLALVTKQWYARGLAAAAAVLILHTTLLTFSRGGMVGLLALGAVAFVIMPKRPTTVGALVVVLLIAVRLTGPELAARYSTAFAEEGERDASSEGRVDLWMDCLKVVGDYPVLGVGPWNWRVIAARYGWPEGKSAHSLWMESAAEIGIPGALALFAFFAIAAVRLWPVARSSWTGTNREDAGIAAGVALSIVGFAVSAQFVSVAGLEVPYYVTMVGVLLLKIRSAAEVGAQMPAVAPSLPGARPVLAPAAVRPTPRPSLAGRPRLLPRLPRRSA